MTLLQWFKRYILNTVSVTAWKGEQLWVGAGCLSDSIFIVTSHHHIYATVSVLPWNSLPCPVAERGYHHHPAFRHPSIMIPRPNVCEFDSLCHEMLLIHLFSTNQSVSSSYLLALGK